MNIELTVYPVCNKHPDITLTVEKIAIRPNGDRYWQLMPCSLCAKRGKQAAYNDGVNSVIAELQGKIAWLREQAS